MPTPNRYQLDHCDGKEISRDDIGRFRIRRSGAEDVHEVSKPLIFDFFAFAQAMRNVGFKAVCIVFSIGFAIMDSSLFVVVLLPFSFKIGFMSASLGDSQLRRKSYEKDRRLEGVPLG